MNSECHCCGFETTLKEYEPNRIGTGGRQKPVWLCDLCAGTMTSSFDEYPEQHDRDALAVMKTICYVGNAILKALAPLLGDRS